MFASRGDPALRMRLLTRAILTSATSSKHASTNVHSLPKCNPSAWIGPWWQGHTATIVLKPRMLGNNAGLGSLVTATHLAENSPVASWGEGVAVEQEKTRSQFSTWTTFESFVRPGIARQGDQARVVEAPVSGVFCGFKAADNTESTTSN